MAVSVPFACGAAEAETLLKERLQELGCREIILESVDFGVRVRALSAEGEPMAFTLYRNAAGRSTKLVVMGKAGNVGERIAPQLAVDGPSENAVFSPRPVKELPELGAHIGTDESGKGDYFGPLVIAGVYANEAELRQLAECGVCDSKLNSDSKNIRLAGEIRRILRPSGIGIVCLSPERYNTLYQQAGNLNTLLAWGHARVIESLLGANPACSTVVADQFGSEPVLQRALLERGRTARLIQTPKGERDAAVAAASVLAREKYLSALERLSEQCGEKLLKGASAAVEAQARRLAETLGKEALGAYAKLHFQTTERALG